MTKYRLVSQLHDFRTKESIGEKREEIIDTETEIMFFWYHYVKRRYTLTESTDLNQNYARVISVSKLEDKSQR